MREKKRYSMRGKMIRANIGIILTALVLCGSIFVISVFLIVGDYIHTDINFFLTTTADNLDDKLSYCEQVIYALRDETVIMEYLEGQPEEEDAKKKAETAFAQAADISSTANLSSGSIPMVEEIYLFDSSGNAISTGYYAMITAEKEKSRKKFEQIYEESVSLNKEAEYAFYKEEAFVYLVFPLLNDGMEQKGSVIFQIRKEAVADMMADTKKYQHSFWALYDRAGGYLDGEGADTLTGREEEIFARFSSVPYQMRLDGRQYRIYRKLACMDMQVVIGIPENQAMILMYDSAKLYILLIAFITAMGCLISILIIYRLTRPIEEITDKLHEVKEGDFESKLPQYESKEFNEISETFNDMTAYINHLVNQVYEKQISIKEMELKFLQTQMNPHFMFNVLNTIALQAKMDGNDEVYKMISSFCQLIQAKIYRDGKEKVKIGQELAYVEYYLSLQSYRFGEHLQYEIKVEEPWQKELYIPKLCIQLLVENAVVHGIEPKVDGGTVRVTIYQKEDTIRIDTTDGGIGFDKDGYIKLPMENGEEDKNHNHVGLNNAHHIIQLMYGGQYGITVWSKKGEGTKISICLPLDYGKEGEEADDKSDVSG